MSSGLRIRACHSLELVAEQAFEPSVGLGFDQVRFQSPREEGFASSLLSYPFVIIKDGYSREHDCVLCVIKAFEGWRARLDDEGKAKGGV